ncbi:hypothetical protein [Kitasatospora sp. NPDC085879]|uniref:hypothetical protein n=1 Tax=Kitasatospora sp. NPDC085879 TaxID=3154769 RepID=UPI000BB12A26|nr:hypothetical protein [Streptomyces sp. TLI_235]PBC69891.1 hypothetical protein BX265_7256 [Streptomyces sp. TLI_235]
MNSWINLNALWKIIVVGLLAGAGLPALFAIGVRALNPPSPTGGAGGRPAAGPLGYTVAGVCFAVLLAAIGWGIFIIVNHG